MNIKKELLDILQDYVEVPVDQIDTAGSFREEGAVDSFVFIELVSAIEELFGISIPNADLIQFRSIDDIVAYLTGRLEVATA